MIHLETQNEIAVLRMQHGKVNAIDIEFLQELNSHLDNLAESKIRALILTGSGSTFSAGVDLFRVLNGGDSYLKEFLALFSPVFEKFFLFPKPLIAATNGHAIAGGCILTCASDYRIMARGTGRIGVTELLVGVPFPLIALEIMRFATPFPYLQQLVYTGHTHLAEDALRMGLVDEIVAPEILMSRAQEIASRFAAIPTDSFRLVKRSLRKPAIDRMKGNQDEIFKAWGSPEIHAVIRNYLGRTIGKNK